jgi:hypothetical protein
MGPKKKVKKNEKSKKIQKTISTTDLDSSHQEELKSEVKMVNRQKLTDLQAVEKPV